MVIYFGFLKFSILTKLQVFDGQYCSGRLRVSSGGCNQKLRFLNLFDSPLTDSSSRGCISDDFTLIQGGQEFEIENAFYYLLFNQICIMNDLFLRSKVETVKRVGLI